MTTRAKKLFKQWKTAADHIDPKTGDGLGRALMAQIEFENEMFKALDRQFGVKK